MLKLGEQVADTLRFAPEDSSFMSPGSSTAQVTVRVGPEGRCTPYRGGHWA
jgi:hypothetical protein